MDLSIRNQSAPLHLVQILMLLLSTSQLKRSMNQLTQVRQIQCRAGEVTRLVISLSCFTRTPAIDGTTRMLMEETEGTGETGETGEIEVIEEETEVVIKATTTIAADITQTIEGVESIDMIIEEVRGAWTAGGKEMAMTTIIEEDTAAIVTIMTMAAITWSTNATITTMTEGREDMIIVEGATIVPETTGERIEDMITITGNRKYEILL